MIIVLTIQLGTPIVNTYMKHLYVNIVFIKHQTQHTNIQKFLCHNIAKYAKDAATRGDYGVTRVFGNDGLTGVKRGNTGEGCTAA